MSAHSPELEKLMAEGNTVRIFGAGVRWWHWIMALSIVVLAVSGFFIGVPLPSPHGEASDWYLMGYIRFIHFTAGYVLAIAFVWRVYLAIIGDSHARQLFVLPVWSPQYYSSLIKQALYYSFLGKEDKHMGHNTLAHTSYFFMIVLGSIYMIFTGFAMYGEGNPGWASTTFGWVLRLHGDSLTVHMWHRLVSWLIGIFVLVHIYMGVRGEIYSRASVMSVMFGGNRTFRA